MTSLPKHPKKHHKPFRIHHVTLFFTGIFLIIISVFGIGFILGKSSSDDIFISPPTQDRQTSSLKEVKSSLGFQFEYDAGSFYAEGRAANRTDTLSGDSLSSGEKLISVSVRPNPNAITGEEVLSEFSIEVEENGQVFENFKASGGYDNNDQALEDYYAPKEDGYFSYEKQKAISRQINGKKFFSIVYKQAPKFGSGSKPIYQTVWLGLNQGRPVKIQIKGLLDSKKASDIYTPILNNLEFGAVASSAIEPLALFGLIGEEDDENKEDILDVNAISPAVVKVYHFICGHLVLKGKAYGGDVCGASVGSGFLISGDGYIATNGHVVAKDAADILVGEFLRNPALLAQFASSEGLTVEEISQGDVIASLLAKIYDLPQSELRLENKDEIILVALGEEPVTADSEKEIRTLKIKLNEDFAKEAQVIDIDYEPKDLLTIEQKTEEGFSASDVALLKIDAQQTPLIHLADSSALQQNAEISLIGFPSDAENNLISNVNLSPSVTNGTISSIRNAKGSESRLFQTDADASQGSSGSPAVSEAGQAFGILTYRFKDNTQANAAKSYIRDITDLKKLISDNGVNLNTESETQEHWEEGLRLFNQSRYSAALEEFKIVYDNYPAHRLVNTYGSQAQKAIREGKDVKDTNYSLLGLIYGGIAGFVGVIIGAALIAHHHKSHQAYKKEQIEN
jgi:S1-C subfamily serine protease